MSTRTDLVASKAKRKILRKKDGSYTVEAAVVLPFFVLAILALAFLIRVVGVSGSTMHIVSDEARRLALDAYQMDTAYLFPAAIRERVLLTCEDVETMTVDGFRYRFQEGNEADQIAVHWATTTKLPLPFPSSPRASTEHALLFRAWTGATLAGPAMPFSEMEEAGEAHTVYVFPQSGTHYHGKDCTYVASAPQQRILDEALRREYAPCRTCKPGDLPNGSLVYCYPQYGEAFHQADCNKVDKFIITMDREDAVARGYAPCSKCGGQ